MLDTQEAAAAEAGQAATRSGKQPAVGRSVEGDVRTAKRIYAQNGPKRDALDEQATPAEAERAAATKGKPAPKRKRGGALKAKPAANADAAAAVKTKAAPKRKGSAAGEAKSTPKRKRGGVAKGGQATAGEPVASAEAGQATAGAQEGTQEAAQEGAPAQATAGGPAAETGQAAAQEAPPPANHRRFRYPTLMPEFRKGPRDIPVDSECLWLVGRRVGAIPQGQTRDAIKAQGPLALWQMLVRIPKRFQRDDIFFDNRVRTNGLEISLQIRKRPGPESKVRPRHTVKEYSGKQKESVPFSAFRDVLSLAWKGFGGGWGVGSAWRGAGFLCPCSMPGDLEVLPTWSPRTVHGRVCASAAVAGLFM